MDLLSWRLWYVVVGGRVFLFALGSWWWWWFLLASHDDLVFERTCKYTVDSMCIFDFWLLLYSLAKRLKGVQEIVVIKSFNEFLMCFFEG